MNASGSRERAAGRLCPSTGTTPLKPTEGLHGPPAGGFVRRPRSGDPSAPASAGENGGHFDGHENIREVNAELGNGAGWRIGGEELGILFVEAGKVAGLGEEHMDLDDILETGAGRPQNGLAVHKRLAGLLLDGGPGHLIGRRIHAGGPRHIDGGAHFDGLAKERRAGRVGGSDDLSGQVESSKELLAVRE